MNKQKIEDGGGKLGFTDKIWDISKESQNKITLWMNHLLVVYAFLIPINSKLKSLVLACIVLLFLYRRDYKYYLSIAFKIDITKYFALFFIIIVFGMLYTSNIRIGFEFINKSKYLIIVAIFLSFLDKRFSFRVLNAFIIGVLFSEVVSYLIHFQVIAPELFIGKYKIYQSLVSNPAPFNDHIKHNTALAVVISILLYRLLIKDIENLYIKVFSVFFITTAFINMSLIGGRTGYIVLFILIFLVASLVYKNQFKKIVFISLSIVFVMFLYMYNFSEQFNTRLQDAKNDIEQMIHQKNYSSSIGLRILGSYYSIKLIKDNFLFGVGTGDVMQEIYKIADEKHSYISRISKPHNIYLEVFAQLGVIGFSIMLLMFYKILKCETLDKIRYDIKTIMTTATLIYMIPGNFFTSFELPMFVTIICAMVCKHEFDINIKPYIKKE